MSRSLHGERYGVQFPGPSNFLPSVRVYARLDLNFPAKITGRGVLHGLLKHTDTVHMRPDSFGAG